MNTNPPRAFGNLNNKVFISDGTVNVTSEKALTTRRCSKRDLVGSPIWSVVTQTRFLLDLPAVCNCDIASSSRSSSATLAISKGSVTKNIPLKLIALRTENQATGHECDPPSGQCLCWRDIGSNAGFIQL